MQAGGRQDQLGHSATVFQVRRPDEPLIRNINNAQRSIPLRRRANPLGEYECAPQGRSRQHRHPQTSGLRQVGAVTCAILGRQHVICTTITFRLRKRRHAIDVEHDGHLHKQAKRGGGPG
ncbi:hypothetical protein GCM10009687_06570 [Asanoa iriomotensis]|uniref:Uncharacterized protein n=1 Tax=Asanoa iriomotensis TaxID=234613 RepID=A0ABQ4C1P5_9ACTN|nr:hypothetical protein Air01nite_28030 [Asanoa iriomotensis]